MTSTNGEIKTIEACGCPTMIVSDYCPFLTCLARTPHRHVVCLDCEAVRHGNMFCETCNQHREKLKL